MGSACVLCVAILTLFVFVLVIGEAEDNFDNRTVAETAEGKLRGVGWTSLSGRKFFAFRGIPYTQPPIGELRFRPPRPSRSWSDVRDASEEGAVCPQFILTTETYVGDEDCLFVNVYTHRQVEKVPVIVWIHGGAFTSGDGGIEENGPEFLMDQNIVLVTFNYRLGILGFLSTGDSAISGNFGNKDQVELLRWVQRNIENFGGDPNKVTIYGYSSGAACAHSHQFSSMSTGLFHRIVYQSGSAFNKFAFDENPLLIANKVGELLNCPIESTDALADCLRKRPAKDLIKIIYNFPHAGSRVPVPYKHVQEFQTSREDPPFLQDILRLIVRQRPVNDVPVITGTTTDESVISTKLIKDTGTVDDDNDIMRILMNLEDISNESMAQIREFYLKDEAHKPLKDVSFESLNKMITDAQFIYGVYSAAKLQSKVSQSPIFYYLFGFQGRISEIMTTGLHDSPLGVGHADDLGYIFRRKVPFPGGPNVDELNTIKRMGEMLAKFANTGDPTPEVSELFPVRWTPIGRKKEFWNLEFGTNEISLKQEFAFKERMEFWDRIFKQERKKRLQEEL